VASSAAAAAKSARTRASGPGTGGRRWRRFALAAALAVALGVASGVAVATAVHVPSVEAYAGFTPRLITRLLDRGGEVFATYSRERRLLVEEGKLPRLLERAVLAAEDAEFYRHGGVDLAGVARTVLVNLRRGRASQGASTITMQLARTLMGRREKTWDRKLAETLLAIELEKRLSKQQILTLYCNLAFLGHGNYGMEVAARDYFGHGVEELTLVEAATLAGILQRPSDYSPHRNPDKVVARRNYVLRRMTEEGWLGRDEYLEASAAPLVLAPRAARREPALYFAEEVRQELEHEFGSERLYGEGLLVTTTLDAGIQRTAEDALREGLLRLDQRRGWRGPLARGQRLDLAGDEIERLVGRNPDPESWTPGLVLGSSARAARVRTPGGELELGPEGVAWVGRGAVSAAVRAGDLVWLRAAPPPAGKEGPAVWTLAQEPLVEGAAIVLESATGAVRALVGGWDFQRNKFDRATQAKRQVGSAFKPFVYGAAFENGFAPADRLFDAPAVFLGADGLPSYSPRNYYRRYYGAITLRRALELSVNVTSVKLLDLVGVERVVDFGRRCGITSALPPYPSLALGSADLVPLEVAAAYAAIANQGIWVRPHFVTEVRRRNGAVLARRTTEAAKAMEPALAAVLTHVLEGVVDRGTAGSIAALPTAIAGKTGTTNDYTDAWFVGYTPRYTILTWVGYDQKKTLGKKMTGAEAALPIWKRIAEAGLRDGWIAKDESFPLPAGVERRAIEPATGLAFAPGAPRRFDELFLIGSPPLRAWEPRFASVAALPWPQQLAFYTPREAEKMPSDLAIAMIEQAAALEAAEEAAGD
jgi:penicillin-binding protein 1A